MQAKEKLVIFDSLWRWSFAGAEQAANNGVNSDEVPEERLSAAKADVVFMPLTARLKSCPFKAMILSTVCGMRRTAMQAEAGVPNAIRLINKPCNLRDDMCRTPRE